MWVIKDLIIHFEKRLSHSEIQYLVDKGFIEPYLLKGDYGYYQYVDYGYGEVYFSYNLFGENTEIEEIVENSFALQIVKGTMLLKIKQLLT